MRISSLIQYGDAGVSGGSSINAHSSRCSARACSRSRTKHQHATVRTHPVIDSVFAVMQKHEVAAVWAFHRVLNVGSGSGM